MILSVQVTKRCLNLIGPLDAIHWHCLSSYKFNYLRQKNGEWHVLSRERISVQNYEDRTLCQLPGALLEKSRNS